LVNTCLRTGILNYSAVSGGHAVQGVDIGRLVAGIAGSNPARGMDVCICIYIYVALRCVGRGHCDELITRPKESRSEVLTAV
jgi:hypothetical protein